MSEVVFASRLCVTRFNSKRCDYETCSRCGFHIGFFVSIPKGAIMRDTKGTSKQIWLLFQFQKVRL